LRNFDYVILINIVIEFHDFLFKYKMIFLGFFIQKNFLPASSTSQSANDAPDLANVKAISSPRPFAEPVISTILS
jgi:hypothetical protein